MIVIIFEESHGFKTCPESYTVDLDKLPADDPYREVLSDVLLSPSTFKGILECPWSASLYVRRLEMDQDGKNLPFPREAVVNLPQLVVRLLYVYVVDDEA